MRFIRNRYSLTLLAMGIAATIVVVLLVSSIFARQQSWLTYSSRFKNYGASETITLGSIPDSTEEGRQAKENLLNCKHSLIVQRTFGASVAIEESIFGFCRMAITFGVESPTALDCLVFSMGMQKWQSEEYGYSRVVSEIIKSSCKSAGLG